MKLKNIISGLAAMLMALCITGCDEEKDPIIIEGDLPIKTSALYMVGDATPNGWDIAIPLRYRLLPTMPSSSHGKARSMPVR